MVILGDEVACCSSVGMFMLAIPPYGIQGRWSPRLYIFYSNVNMSTMCSLDYYTSLYSNHSYSTNFEFDIRIFDPNAMILDCGMNCWNELPFFKTFSAFETYMRIWNQFTRELSELTRRVRNWTENMTVHSFTPTLTELKLLSMVHVALLMILGWDQQGFKSTASISRAPNPWLTILKRQLRLNFPSRSNRYDRIPSILDLMQLRNTAQV